MSDTAATWLKRWMKQHAAAENAFAADLQRFFLRQAREVLAALKDAGDSPSPIMVAQFFRPADENDKLLIAALPHLVGGMATGCLTQLKPRGNKTKALDPEDIRRQLEEFDLPEYAKLAVEQSLAELATQPYWIDIQKTTQNDIVAILQKGIEAGDAGSTMAKNVRVALGSSAKVRSKAIARTETTLAFNAGHQVAFDALAANGDIAGKTWLAIADDDAREDHAALNETTVKPRDNFSVGGSPAPYPGHWSLPAAQRVNCRCTVIGSFDNL